MSNLDLLTTCRTCGAQLPARMFSGHPMADGDTETYRERALCPATRALARNEIRNPSPTDVKRMPRPGKKARKALTDAEINALADGLDGALDSATSAELDRLAAAIFFGLSDDE